MQWKEARKRDTNWRRGLPSQAVCLIELRDEAAEPLLVREQDLCRRVQRLLGPPDPASRRLNLREAARGIRCRLTGSRFEQIFTYYRLARQHFPQRYQNMLRLRLPAIQGQPPLRVYALRINAARRETLSDGVCASLGERPHCWGPKPKRPGIPFRLQLPGRL